MKSMAMENTTEGHMNHGTMEHHSTAYFHFSAHATILFAGWTTTTWGEMLGSCVGVAVLAILYEGLKVLREFIDAKFGLKGRVSCGQVQLQESTDNGNKPSSTINVTAKHQRIEMLRPAHWLQTLMHFVQLWIGLSLMLVFMTFNVYLCLAVTVGGALGYFLFAWIHRPGRCYEMCCD